MFFLKIHFAGALARPPPFLMPVVTALVTSRVTVTFDVLPIVLAARRRSDGYLNGVGPDSHRSHHRIIGSVDHRHVVGTLIRDIGKGPVRSDGYPNTQGFAYLLNGSDVSANDMLAAVRQQGLEGVVGKRKDSLYQPGKRSGSWVKCR